MGDMTKTLAFDTSTKFLSIALFEGDVLKREYHKEAGITHSAVLIPTIKNEIDALSWKISDIGLIAVGSGPGSFTGLRIAAATVKALSAAVGCKIMGVPGMDAMAARYRTDEKYIAPLLDARKGKVYSCFYEKPDQAFVRRGDFLLVTLAELLRMMDKKTIFFGDGVGPYRSEIEKCANASIDPDADWYPRASEIGRIGIEKAKTGTDDPETFEPLYLHPKECNITCKRS
ncbi:MAG TPA: tRNA (adenosine(37)-N6)-threonylcarbamoyltransferase complex dimerization subunit type 1 TsaB [Candidatus Omnitrophota bacterium]|nr:tRNA (adenosine(37)-N6)-threonylcarbamoyltransferase complex dimerization subunit type 1 TsaB [Candidatus Omnitrophota bacterium]